MTAAIRYWTRQINLYTNALELDAHKVDREPVAHWEAQLKLAEAALAAQLAEEATSGLTPELLA